MINALTIDVEDYFHVTAFSKDIKKGDWDSIPSRIEKNTLKVLDILDDFSIKATFFILGWVAERFPSLIKKISARNHEIASHGYEHDLIYNINSKRFRADVRKSKKLLEDLCGEKIIGYRAPSYSITKNSFWALDILIEEGFLYDSSIFPITHDLYGIPKAERFPHDIKRPSGVIKEFPLSTIEIKLAGIKCRIPVAGGGYLRLLPVSLIKKAINHININEKKPALLYFHPWEIDPKQPRIKAKLKSKLRHYLNLGKTEKKVKILLSSFEFAPIKNVLGFSN